MRSENDSSVKIGKNATITNSAVGAGASVTSERKSKSAIIWLAGVIVSIIVGVVTNYIYDWTKTLTHLFSGAP